MLSFDELERSVNKLLGRPWHAVNRLVSVHVLTQQLRLFTGRRLVAVYPVSTSASGTGNRQDSGCTPTGWHCIAQKIGAGCTPGTIFKGRVAGAVAASLCDQSSDDLITSRVLWLRGMQPGINLGGDVDSFERYIYLHGTAQEQLIGRPVSHGCVRLVNRHVIELFDQIEEGTPVYISPHD